MNCRSTRLGLYSPVPEVSYHSVPNRLNIPCIRLGFIPDLGHRSGCVQVPVDVNVLLS